MANKALSNLGVCGDVDSNPALPGAGAQVSVWGKRFCVGDMSLT